MADAEAYKPAIPVHTFSSRGVQTRTPVPELGRAVHTHSYIERGLLLVTLFNGDMRNFQEQYALDRSITLGAAEALRIRHPVVGKRAREPLVMTMDALVTKAWPNTDGVYMQGWDAKPHAHLENPRVLEKLSLHRAYCHQLSFTHHIFTDQSVPKQVLKNIDWLRASLPAEGELMLIDGLFTYLPQLMLAEVAAGGFDGMPIYEYALDFDLRNSLPRGAALRVFKYLSWTRALYIDLNAERPAMQPINGRRKAEPVHIQTFLNNN
jgi:hypothetical protein